MLSVVLFGKSEVLEDVRWAKKSSGLADEQERIKKASLLLNLVPEAMGAFSDASLDTQKIADKIKGLGVPASNNDDLQIFCDKIVKEMSIHVLFEKSEMVPGRPEFKYGVGVNLLTYPIFFEDKVYKTVDSVQVKKKMGLFKEESKVQEKKVMPMSELFGSSFKDNAWQIAVASKEKDSKGDTRFSLRVKNNLVGATTLYPENLDRKFKDDGLFFEALSEHGGALQTVLNRIYEIIGYDVPPDVTIFLGKGSSSEKATEVTKEDGKGVPILDLKYS